MPLTAGARLGPYEVLAKVGAGGMGEVYRARDTRLDRVVAIKVLSPELASDPQFRQRFELEARAISALDHPHICALYDVGGEHDQSFLVMQYLEGETLEARLQRGALPFDQALQYATQIADALDKAHRAGIVHRDLKPGNIMLTKSGAKLLDFGLAKAAAPSVAGGSLSMLPTTPPSLTARGAIVGTFQYMSPEQLEGLEADTRTDIFAFGSVVYEMLTGKRAFTGASQASLTASILDHHPPPVSSVQPISSPLLDHLVTSCLVKARDGRWQTMADVLIQLNLIAKTGGRLTAPEAGAAGGWRRLRLALLAGGGLALLALGFGAARWFTPTAPAAAPLAFEVAPAGTVFQFQFALSPDGKRLVAMAGSDKGPMLWLRALDSVEGRFVPGSEGAQFPFWSPDSRFIGFFAGGKLKKVDIFGSPSQVLSDAGVGHGGAWNAEGQVVFAPSGGGPLMRVAATGGQAQQATELDAARQEISHRHPHFLPDGRHFLFTAISGRTELSGIHVGSLDSRQSTPLLSSLFRAVFAPPDRILFVRENKLMAQRFDPVRLRVEGDPYLVVPDEIGSNTTNSSAAIAASNDGVLAYRPGTVSDRYLLWHDRAGASSQAAPPGPYQNPVLSPDSKRLAFAKEEGGNTDIWVMDLSNGTSSRLTFDAAVDNTPVWSPDGSRIVFRSNRSGTYDLYQKNSSNVGTEDLVFKSERPKIPEDWSPDGRFLVYRDQDPRTGADLWILPLMGDRRPQPFSTTAYSEMQGKFSPDGRWIAYVSNESGQDQVYVQSFPVSGGKWQVSFSGGYQPRWRADAKELFFFSGARDVMAAAVQVSTAGVFNQSAATKLFAANPVVLFTDRNSLDVMPDGKRFLVNSAGAAGLKPITVIVNWPATVKQ